MSERIYVDANVYLDYFLRRQKKEAWRVFDEAIKCRFEIVVSDWLLHELEKRGEKEEIASFLMMLKAFKKLVATSVTSEEWLTARHHENTPDYAHALVARRTGCVFVVTRDKNFPRLVETKLPEDL